MTEELERLYVRDVDVMIEALRHTVIALYSGVATDTSLDKAFRYAHSIKSQADAVGRSKVAQTAHVLEDLLSTVRSAGVSAVSREDLVSQIQFLRRVFDQENAAGTPRRNGGLAAASARLAKTDGEAESVAAAPGRTRLDRRAGLAQRLSRSVRTMIAEAEQRGERAYLVSVHLVPDVSMPDMRFYLVQTNLERTVALLTKWTSDEGATPSFNAVVTTSQTEDELRRIVSVDEVARVEVDAVASRQLAPVDWRRDGARDLHGHQAPSSEYDDASARAQLAAHELGRLITSARRLGRDMSGGRQDREQLLSILRGAASLTGRIQADLDDQLSTRFGDLAEAVVESVESMAESRGKRVEVQLLGAWARIPKGIESTLGDMLVQLARNSLDHGIESATQRTSRGKPAKGSITIGAEEGDRWVSVWVEDDGRGINEEKVRSTNPSLAQDTPLLSILSQPGFTTVDGDRSSSGRGVGLDVVLHTVENLLLGKLSLQTKLGVGARFTLRFPAGAQALDVIVVGLRNRRLAIPRILVDDVRTMHASDFTVNEGGERFVAVDGAYCPVCGAGLQSPPATGATAVVVNGTAGRAVLLGTGIISEERVLRYRNSPYQIYSQALDKSVALLVPTHGC